jgi:hypothetical protein
MLDAAEYRWRFYTNHLSHATFTHHSFGVLGSLKVTDKSNEGVN